jgi:hypothetical protein
MARVMDGLVILLAVTVHAYLTDIVRFLNETLQ